MSNHDLLPLHIVLLPFTPFSILICSLLSFKSLSQLKYASIASQNMLNKQYDNFDRVLLHVKFKSFILSGMQNMWSLGLHICYTNVKFFFYFKYTLLHVDCCLSSEMTCLSAEIRQFLLIDNISRNILIIYRTEC